MQRVSGVTAHKLKNNQVQKNIGQARTLNYNDELIEKRVTYLSWRAYAIYWNMVVNELITYVCQSSI